MKKSEIRRIYLDKRQRLTDSEIGVQSRRIAGQFFTAVDLDRLSTLHCFIAISKFHEIDTTYIFERIWAQFPHIKTVAPRIVAGDASMQSIAIRSLDKLEENSWGIREPAGGSPIDPVEIDLVIVPLLAFDELGHRVGYGKGFYDKFLANCRPDCVKIGLSYFAPISRISDVTDHDIKLDHCVTPERVH